MASTPKPGPAKPAAEDPSMDDILASIRRILSEDQHSASLPPIPPPPTPAPPISEGDDVLILDPSMMLPEPLPAAPPDGPGSAGALPGGGPPVVDPPALISPDTARAAVASVAGLVRTLTVDRGTQARGGGLTIEDMVRAELRPMLKEWMDANLPQLVERLVRAELERVIGRVGG